MSAPTDPAGDLGVLRRRLYQPRASDADVERYRAAVTAALPPPPPVAATRPARRTAAARFAVPAAVAVGALLLGAVVATSTPRRAGTLELTGDLTSPTPHPVSADPAQPGALMTTRNGDEVSFTGVGPGTIPLDRSTLSFDGGVVRVAMLTTTAEGVGCIDTRPDWSSYDHTLARGHAAQEMAPVTPVQFEYSGAAPMTVQVSAPARTRWWLDLRLPQRSE